MAKTASSTTLASGSFGVTKPIFYQDLRDINRMVNWILQEQMTPTYLNQTFGDEDWGAAGSVPSITSFQLTGAGAYSNKAVIPVTINTNDVASVTLEVRVVIASATGYVRISDGTGTAEVSTTSAQSDTWRSATLTLASSVSAFTLATKGGASGDYVTAIRISGDRLTSSWPDPDYT